METKQLELPEATPKPKRRRNRWGKDGFYFSAGYVWKVLPDLRTVCLGPEAAVLAALDGEGEPEAPEA